MICHTGVTAISLVAGRFTPLAPEGNPILGFPLQQWLAQEKAPDPAGHSANAEDSGDMQRLYTDVSCWPSVTQQSSGLTALKLQAGQTSYGTSEPMGSRGELLYSVTSRRKRNGEMPWVPGQASMPYSLKRLRLSPEFSGKSGR